MSAGRQSGACSHTRAPSNLCCFRHNGPTARCRVVESLDHLLKGDGGPMSLLSNNDDLFRSR